VYIEISCIFVSDNNTKKIETMKTFRFTFEDKKGNELDVKFIECLSKKEAIEIARNLQANSMLNDLHTIKTRLA
jgi:hypothetical protein